MKIPAASRVLTIAIILIMIAVVFVAEDFTFDPNTIPNPTKLNSWVVDVSNTLTKADIDEINAMIDGIKARTTVEIAVCVVPNTGGDEFSAAQALFDLWKIGNKETNNGMLLLLSIDEHRFRTHTGYGLEGTLPDSMLKYLQDTIAVPLFKEGKYAEGLKTYIAKLDSIIEDPELGKDIQQQAIEAQESKSQRRDIVWPAFIFVFAGLAVMGGGIALLLKGEKTLASQRANAGKSYSSVHELDRKGFLNDSLGGALFAFPFGAIFFAIGLLVTGILGSNGVWALILIPLSILFSVVFAVSVNSMKAHVIRQWRHSPHECPKCGKEMAKLDEEADDKYLSNIEQTEEKIRSQDYDVYLCNACSNKIIEVYRDRKYNAYSQCPSCKGYTDKATKTQTLVQPTYTSTGTSETDYLCLACGNKHSEKHTIPVLQRSSSSGSSSGGSSGGGRSFGGGSSGGGGASSGW